MDYVSLEYFKGDHVLTGCDEVWAPDQETWQRVQDTLNSESIFLGVASMMLIQMDNKNFLITEDEKDGYRSNLKEIIEIDHSPKNTFEPVNVFGVFRPGYDDELMDMFDSANGLQVSEFGTDYISDDYYPYFIGTFTPENMDINNRD